MTIKKICGICGKDFSLDSRSHKNSARYCSEECRREATRISVAKYRSKKEFVKETKVKRDLINEALNECKEKGMTYAQRQINKTLELLKETHDKR